MQAIKSIELKNEIINGDCLQILKSIADTSIDLVITSPPYFQQRDIISTLKYYLRFIEDYGEFIKTRTKNLISDAKNSTEVKSFHLENWNEILETYKIEK